MTWVFGFAGLVIGGALAVWVLRRVYEARVEEVEASWTAKIAQGDRAFAARLREQEAASTRERERIEEDWAAKLSAREAGWKNRLEIREVDLKSQLEDLDAELAARRGRDAVATRPLPRDRFMDLTGIGKSTAHLLAEREIMTFWTLANTSVNDLRALLDEAGGQYRRLDPTHWPSQARLAAENRVGELRELKEWIAHR